jgi:hypothetical protein
MSVWLSVEVVALGASIEARGSRGVVVGRRRTGVGVEVVYPMAAFGGAGARGLTSAGHCVQRACVTGPIDDGIELIVPMTSPDRRDDLDVSERAAPAGPAARRSVDGVHRHDVLGAMSGSPPSGTGPIPSRRVAAGPARRICPGRHCDGLVGLPTVWPGYRERQVRSSQSAPRRGQTWFRRQARRPVGGLVDRCDRNHVRPMGGPTLVASSTVGLSRCPLR